MTPAALLARLIERDEAVTAYVQVPEGDREGRYHIINRHGKVVHKHCVDKPYNALRGVMMCVACEWPSRNEIYRPIESC